MSKGKDKRPIGRPSVLSPEMASAICDRLANAEALRAICRDPDMPGETTVYRWLDENEAFREQYTRARARAMERLADELLEIADDSASDTYEDEDGTTRTNHDVVARAKLRVDTRKWLMAKLAPKKYGDRLGLDVDMKVSLAERIKAARERAIKG